MVKRLLAFALLLLTALSAVPQEDWIRTGTGLGVEKVRLAAPEFQLAFGSTAGSDTLRKVFNDTLWNDLEHAGIFDLVSKSFYPLSQPARPADVVLDAWRNPPPNAGMLAFGNLGVDRDRLTVKGWLYDTKNDAAPQVLAKQYSEPATPENARLIAHRFADEIISRLGGGLPGIAESKIFFISNRSGHKEVWVMDYDGEGQRQLTRLGSIALSPRVSPDGSRVAFTSFASGGVELAMYSMELGRLVSFPHYGGTNASPAWSPDGTKMAFSSSMRGNPEIYVAEISGASPKRLTSYKGTNISPVWNPKSGAQIAFVSGRSGLPQIYVMDADGANVQRFTDGGYAVSPSWSPNGQFLTFAWNRNYGPGAPGGQDIYLMDIATHKWVQLTRAGNNDSPSWSPDGRHIVFQSNRSGGQQVWSMLADGSQQRPLTASGGNTQPNWSWK
jgi:TolB protein